MPWNEPDHAKYAVIRTRYASELSDTEFAIIEPLLPAPKRRGRKLSADSDPREILNALFYLVRTGGPWRYLSKDFPPFTAVQNRFYAWRDSGCGTTFSPSWRWPYARRKGRMPRPQWCSPIVSP